MLCRAAGLVVALSAVTAAPAGEWFVDASAAAGGDGSAERPFQQITDGLKVMQGGDVITVRQGVYRETLSLSKGGSQAQPSTLRAAEGHRVIVSGFAPIRGWTERHDGVYTTTVDGSVEDLYVGYVAQRIASSLDKEDVWAAVSAADQQTGRLILGDAYPRLPAAAQIAAAPGDACVFMFFQRGNYFSTIPIQAIDATKGELTVEGKSLRGAGGQDRLTLCNHQSLIDRPGEWACETVDGRSTLFFMPARPDDLEHTQTISQERQLLSVGHWRDPQTDITVEGIEFAGSRMMGISAGKTTRLNITRCIFHNHGRNGVLVRGCEDVRIANCIAFANHTGLSVASCQRAAVEENEVFANYVDGIIVAGDVSGSDAEPETHEVIVRRNYVHHHLLHGHPDNFQTYRGVHDITFQDNLVILAGQSLMTEQTYGGRLINNVIFGADARLIIFGHQSSNDWEVTNNTLGFGGWGAIGMDGEGYTISQNIFLNNVLGRDRDYTGDYNLLWNHDPSAGILRVTRPRWTTFTEVAPYAEQTGHDQNSRRADPQLKNVPLCQAVATDLDKCTANHLELRGGNAARLFREGDHIEINGDGQSRQVTEVGPSHIRFTPALPVRPWRITLVWNWRDHTDFALDFTPLPNSPARTMGPAGQHVGALLNAAAYRAGDFNADGHRDLPPLAEDLQAAIPAANDPVVLLTLP
jgi:hypothetical protein